MRFENIATGKENVECRSGEVLILYNESVGKSEAYMVIRNCGMYNMLNLNSGEVYYSDFKTYDDFAEKVGQIFTFVEVIDNNKLELVIVED